MIKKTLFVIIFLALNFFPLAFAQEKKDQAIEHYQRGNFLYEQGNYQEAEKEFQKALELLNQTKQVVTKPTKEAQPKVAQPAEVKPESKPKSGEYIIGEEDVLHISVWQNPDLDQDAIVRPDGRISFPLIGDIQATGLTIPELDQQISEKLKDYIKYPEVSISITKIGGKKVIVLGEVIDPGVYSVTGAKTIMEAIGLASGFTRDAVPSSTVLIRGGFSQPQAQRINLSKAIAGDVSQNVTLQAEDIVFVPKKFIADINYFLKQILEPLQSGSKIDAEMLYWIGPARKHR